MKKNNYNIWIVNHYAQDSELPGGTRHYDIGCELTKLGVNVTILCSSYHYTLLRETELYDDDYYKTKTVSGVRFIKFKTMAYQKNGFRRFFNLLHFSINFMRWSFANSEKPDVIIGSTVHPFAAFAASLVAKNKKSKFVFELRDLWPQTFIDMKRWNEKGLLSQIFRVIEKATAKSSAEFIVLSPLTIPYLVDRYGVSRSDILLLPNGVSEEMINFDLGDSVDEDNQCREILYLGAIDEVHGLDFLIALANELRHNKLVRFRLLGQGKHLSTLKAQISSLGLDNVDIAPPVPKSKVLAELRKADFLFLSTANVLYGSENKLYEYMLAGKPIIAATTALHNNPVKEIGCGITLDRDDLRGSQRKVTQLLGMNTEDLRRMGESANMHAIKHHSISVLSKKLLSFLTEKIRHIER
jgi:glycosyltransferase involved in cell wall biosynthesis